MLLPSVNKAAHSGFEIQRRHHQKSKTGVSVAPQKGLMSSENLKNKNIALLTNFKENLMNISEQEIQFILQEIRNYLSPDVNVRRGDVLSAWSGIRPLVTNPNASNTQSLARNHIIEISASKMITIAGRLGLIFNQTI